MRHILTRIQSYLLSSSSFLLNWCCFVLHCIALQFGAIFLMPFSLSPLSLSLSHSMTQLILNCWTHSRVLHAVAFSIALLALDSSWRSLSSVSFHIAIPFYKCFPCFALYNFLWWTFVCMCCICIVCYIYDWHSALRYVLLLFVKQPEQNRFYFILPFNWITFSSSHTWKLCVICSSHVCTTWSFYWMNTTRIFYLLFQFIMFNNHFPIELSFRWNIWHVSFSRFFLLTCPLPCQSSIRHRFLQLKIINWWKFTQNVKCFSCCICLTALENRTIIEIPAAA